MSKIALVRSLYEHDLHAARDENYGWQSAVDHGSCPHAEGTFDRASVVADARPGSLFRGLPAEWSGFSAEVRAFVDLGDEVAVVGSCCGTSTATGRPMRGAFAHLWTVCDGKLDRIAQHLDAHEAEDPPVPADA